MKNRIPLSVLSLAAVGSDGTIASAFSNTVRIAQATEKFGYSRFWLAEHHNMPGIASSSTAVLIGHVAGQTSKIRVGSGGIMLPNHAPMVVAEAFGTLETLYPGRIDLGLGRAPGTDPLTVRALRRDLKSSGNDFPGLVEELEAFLAPAIPGQAIRAVPGAGLDIPIWILGSSLWSAEFAAVNGYPYAFAAHFAPKDFLPAMRVYRDRFEPSARLKAPHTMACVPVIAADTDEKAEYLATSTKQKILGLVSGRFPTISPPPVESMDGLWNEAQKAAVENFLGELVVGGPETVRAGLQALTEKAQVDEIMIHTDLYDMNDTIRSYEILKDCAPTRAL